MKRLIKKTAVGLLIFFMLAEIVPIGEILSYWVGMDNAIAYAEDGGNSYGAKFLAPIGDRDPNAIEIWTAVDLNDIKDDYAASYVLMQDIDLSAWGEWYPLGTSTTQFTGIFDGQGHSIKNMSIFNYLNYAGLFGHAGGTIKNVGIENCYIEGGAFAGGIVARAYGTTITNCYNTAEINSRGEQAGGIVGGASGNVKIDYCYNTGKIYSGRSAGGIVGIATNTITIDHSYNTGSITSDNSVYEAGRVYSASEFNAYAGGIIGRSYDLNVLNSHNTGTIKAAASIEFHETLSHNATTESCAGGIVGSCTNQNTGNSSGTIEQCYNTGSISSIQGRDSNAGGIAGNVGTIENCYNIGVVYAESEHPFDAESSAGGIAGFAYNISKCYSGGKIYSKANYYYVKDRPEINGIYLATAGGIYGNRNIKIQINNCVAFPSVLDAAGYNSWTDDVSDICYAVGYGIIKGDGNLVLEGTTGENAEDYDLVARYQLLLQSTYDTHYWDFDSVWMMPAYGGYPVLQGLVALRDGEDDIDDSTLRIKRVLSPENATISNKPIAGGISGTVSATVPSDRTSQFIDIEPNIEGASWTLSWTNNFAEYEELDSHVLPLIDDENSAIIKLMAPDYETVYYHVSIVRDDNTFETIDYGEITGYAKRIYNKVNKGIGVQKGFDGYWDNIQESKLYYQKSINKATDYTKGEKTVIDVSKATVSLVISAFIAPNLPGAGAESSIMPLASYAYSSMITSLELITGEPADFNRIKSLDDFVYDQAMKGFDLINSSIGDMQEYHSQIKRDGGNITDAVVAAKFIESYYNIEAGMASLRMGKNYFVDRLNTSPITNIGKILEGAFKEVATSLAAELFMGPAGSTAITESVKFLAPKVLVECFDGIDEITARYDNSHINQWREELYKISAELISTLSVGNPHYYDRIFEIDCPVDVEIYNDDGGLITTVSDYDEQGFFDEIVVWTVDDHKYIQIPWFVQDYTIKLVGTDNGTMNFIVKNIDALADEMTVEKMFSNVVITKDKQFLSYIGKFDETSLTPLYVMDVNGDIIANISTNGTEVPVDVGDSQSTPLQSISLNKTTTTLPIGQTETLTVTYNPENTTDDRTVLWSTSDSSVATVSDEGVVTAVGAGTATITATVANNIAHCEITVSSLPSVVWTGLSANGVANTADTTELTLTFDADLEGLLIGDIVVTGATKGELSGADAAWTLSILDIEVPEGDVITVEIADPAGYSVTPKERTVVVHRNTFVPVTNITSLPAVIATDTDVVLSGVIVPSNATNQNITWRVKDDGNTGSVISGNVLRATAPGTVVITATIANGLTDSSDYTKDFTIEVSDELLPPLIPPPDSTTYTITAIAGTNGSISPSGVVTVSESESLTFTVTANSGYHVDTVTVDGAGRTLNGNAFTFTGVVENHSISVTFARNSTGGSTSGIGNPDNNDTTGKDPATNPDGTATTAPGGYTTEIIDSDTPLSSGLHILWDNPFTDVYESDWFYDAVAFVYTQDLFAGTSATTFAPRTPMSRAMLVTVLYKLAGSPTLESVEFAVPTDLPVLFSDIDGDQYYSDAIAWAVQNGLVAGVGGGKFDPDAPVTRQDLTVTLYKYALLTGKGPQGNWAIRLDYVDLAEVSDYATEALMWATLKGIVGGKPGKVFDPNGIASRAEVAAILRGFIEAAE